MVDFITPAAVMAVGVAERKINMPKKNTDETNVNLAEDAETNANLTEDAAANAEDPMEYVDHAPLFKDGERYKFPLNVTINGVKYSVPRGVPLRLPRVVAEVIDQSIAQDAYAHEVDTQMQKTQVVNF
jgi:hypothetical protein